MQSWLNEKQLSASSTPPEGPSAAPASIRGSTREAAAPSGRQPPQQPAGAGPAGRVARPLRPRPRPGPASPRPSSLSSAPPRPLLPVPRTQPPRGRGPRCLPPLVASPRPGSPLANWRRLWAEPPCWRPAPNSETRLAIGRRRVTPRLQATWRCFHCQGGRAAGPGLQAPVRRLRRGRGKADRRARSFRPHPTPCPG